MPSLSVHVSASFDRIVLMVVGDLDHDTCPRIREVTDAVSIRDRTVCLDLAGVAFMDARGLGMLQKLQRYTHAQGGRLELSGLQSEPRRVLELTGTLTQFHVTTGPGTPLRLPAYRAAS